MITNEMMLMARLADDGVTLRKQLAQVQQQAASGRASDTYSGLGPAARTSLDLRPTIAHQTVWQSNIDAAQARLDVTQSALKSISSIAADFYQRVNNLNDVGASQVADIAGLAKSALQQVGQLLNSKSGDTYVFAGQDTANPPVPNTDPAVLGAALLASDTATAPFSTTLGSAVPQVEVGEGERMQVGLLANKNTLATSTAPTTGSYMRDVMRALATLATLTPTSPGIQATAADTRTRLSSAITAMATETGALGDFQNTLKQRQTALGDTSTALSAQLSSIEDVDVAAALTKASTLQTQLQASYQIIAGSRQLSLANFIR
jgi:flagellar hook-associated protein 3 FlgL